MADGIDLLTLKKAKRYADGPPVRIVCIGDSITRGAPADMRTYTQWFDVLTGRLHTTINKGVSGEWAAQVLARFDADVIALSPDYVLINVGKNDISNGGPLATAQQAIADMVQKASFAGIVPILSTVIPYGSQDGGPTFSTQNQTDTLALNRWIRAYAKRNGLKCLDFYEALHGTDDWSDDAYVLSDNLHPSRLGMTILAGVVAEAFGKKTLAQQVYQAEGNLLLNALMEIDTNADGLPDSWVIYKDASSTVTTSLSTHPVQGKLLKLVYSAPTAVYGTVRQSLTGWAKGDVIQCNVDASLSVVTGSHANKGFMIRLRTEGTAVSGDALPRWKDPISGLWRFESTLTVPTGATLLHFEVGFLDVEAGTAYFGRPEVRIIS